MTKMRQQDDQKVKLQDLRSRLLLDLQKADTLQALDRVRIAALGKKGLITQEMRKLSCLDTQHRKSMGRDLNALKQMVYATWKDKIEALRQRDIHAKLKNDTIDMTLEAPRRPQGKIHPITQTMDAVVDIFSHMGFSVVEGPDIEDDWHNFQALNMPVGHPARQMQDTFYIAPSHNQKTTDENALVLRTHTSPVQVRSMRRSLPPIRIISLGRTFRCDSDMTHTPMFHQVEGLVIDKAVNFSHLKGTLGKFVDSYFSIEDIPLRFRPSFFPFTEPSAEVDIGCLRKEGAVTIGKNGSWLEILGCGLVNPKVLENCGIDSKTYQGFAFGMGIERIAILKHGIEDLRTFFDADIRWLRHYGFKSFDIPSLIHGL